MNTIVCVKQVLDPEIPPAKFKIDPGTKQVIPPPGVPPVISVYDERAVEAACVLAKAIQKIGGYDLVLCGRQAADWGAGQVGSILAEILGIPVVTLACNIEAVDKKLRVKRMVKDGYEVLEAPMPTRKTECEIIAGGNPGEAAVNLALKLVKLI